MGEDPGAGGTQLSGNADPDEIRSEIEETREQLGDTVEELAHKTDVKAQAKQKVEEAKSSASQKREQLLGKARNASPDSAATAASQVSQKARENPLPLAAAGAFAAGFVFGRLSRR